VGPAASLALKLVLTPLLVGGASLAGRRWGSEIGGWLVGIPFTSGPIAFFLALNPGPRFAAATAVGIMAGVASQAAFCVAYAWTAQRRGWAPSPLVGTAAFLALTAVLNLVFFLMLAELLPGQGIAIAFAAAILVALALQGVSLALGRRLGLA